MFRNMEQLIPQLAARQQDSVFVSPKDWSRIGQELLGLWQQMHGAPDGTVSVMVVQNGLIVFIETAFSQAELALARHSTDNLLSQYIDGLARQMIPPLSTCVKKVVNLQIMATSITPNIEQNWMMIYVKFDEPVEFNRSEEVQV